MTARMNSAADPSDRHGVIVAHYGVAVEVAFANGERCAVRVKRGRHG